MRRLLRTELETLEALPHGTSVNELLAASSDPRVTRYLEWRPSREGAESFLASSGSELDSGSGVHYAIRARADGRLLGVAALVEIDRERGQAEGTTWLAPNAWSQGVARRARRALLELAFDEWGFRAVSYRVASGNLAALRSLAAFAPKLIAVVPNAFSGALEGQAALVLELRSGDGR